MSSDELKRKTVCLKLAKNGIYLCKNPSNAKFVPSRDVSFGLKQLKDYNEQSKSEVRTSETPSRKSEKAKKETEEETVLQKFIRGFDCGEFCDDSLSSGYSSSVGECSSGAFNSSESLGCTSQDRKQVTSDSSASGSRPHCRVEFITPVKVGDTASRDSVKPVKPLIVDLSQKKILLKDNPVKIVKSTPNQLRQLNRNFITPKVKVENFSHFSDSSSLPLIISPAETPNFSGSSSSRSPYPSTKIEIDYTGSSIQDDRYADSDFSRPVNSENTEYSHSPKLIFNQDDEFILPDNEGFDDAYRNFNNMIQHNSYWNNNTGQNQSYNTAQHSSNMNQQQTANMHLQQSYNMSHPQAYNVNHHQQPYNINQHQLSNINHHQSSIIDHQSSNIDHHSYNLSQHQSYNNLVQQQSHKNVNQSYSNMNHPHQSLVAEGESEADIMKAAKSLHSKRTRTLFHWINPNMPKARLKDSVMSAWDLLPTWQKQIYVNQVISKCGNDSVTPMINPQILDINGMAEVVMSSMNQAEEEALVQPPKKKRKYTRKSTNTAASNRASSSSSSLPSLSPSSSLYNFLSSL